MPGTVLHCKWARVCIVEGRETVYDISSATGEFLALDIQEKSS